MPSPVALALSQSTISITIPTSNSSDPVCPGSIDAVIAKGWYAALPAPWPPASTDPAIEVVVTNGSASAPIAAALVDVFTDPATNTTATSIFAELTTVMPGATVDEIVLGLPVTTMYLVTWPLSIDDSEFGAPGAYHQATFTVTVAANKL